MIFFTSDQHFRHARILKYCPNRKFSSIEDHDEYLIKVWNETVKKDDTVFTLGDFAFGRVEDSFGILDRLPGKKVLITGNHDVRHLKRPEFRERFAAIKYGYHEVEVSFRGHTALIVLCHFPLQSWNKSRYGSFHLFGHVHNHPVLLPLANMADVGVDTKPDLGLWEKNEILTKLSPLPVADPVRRVDPNIFRLRA